MKLFHRRPKVEAPLEVRRGALLTLNRVKTGQQIYAGTVPAAEKARRRAKAKAGRRADLARRRAVR